ncbi:MAG: prepilin-type N-terminal cleavage/methylation domain-containing protein [Kiritimatiellae bacterium]|nr:prepilin-type N-terminal cleavage/methylation domain-containing protein [Kiritimatiellia bacterium]
MTRETQRSGRAAGFTLLELMMAIMIMAIMMILSFFCFDAVVQSWNAGMEMSDSMAQADYVMNQVVSGLRSAYYSSTVAKDEEKGFQFVDGGEGAEAHDSITWMKVGRAFVGNLKAIDGKTEIAEMPHRVSLYVEEQDRDGGGGLMAKAWSSDFQPDDFDVEEDVKAFLISPKVVAMDCKVLKEPPEEKATEIKWEDEWSSSNSLPYKVSVTLYLRPFKEGDAPVAVTRDIEIPVWDVSQNPVKSDGGGKTGKGTQTGQGGTGARPGVGGPGQQMIPPGVTQ